MESSSRPDGREMIEARNIQFELHDYACVFKLGSTIVSCRTLIKEVAPKDERPSEGFFRLSVSSALKLEQHFRTEVLNSIREAIIKSRALDLESLVINIGKTVWSLESEIVILENDGGLFEAITMAVLGSLLQVKLPGPRGLRPLVLHHLPIAVSFAFIDIDHIFVDPTEMEIESSNGFLTIFGNVAGDICSINKNGGVPITPNIFSYCNVIASDIIISWHSALLQKMGKDAPLLLLGMLNNKKSIPEPQLEPQVPVIDERIKPSKEEEEEETNDNALDLGLLAILYLNKQ